MRRGNGSSRCNSFHLCVDAWFVFFPLLAIRLTVFQNWCYFNKAHTEVLVTFKLLEGLNISDTLPVCVRALVSSLIKNVNLGKVAGFEKYCAAVSPPPGFVLLTEDAVCCCASIKGFLHLYQNISKAPKEMCKPQYCHVVDLI